MSIQAVAWALEQDLPARPKLVLVSIANHADHTTGYCWLKAETIAGESACTSRSVYRFIGGLVRNGYIRKAPRKGADGKQRANDYWIMFGREEKEWDWDAGLDGPDGDDHAETEDQGDAPQDVVVPYERISHGKSTENDAAAPVDKPPVSLGPCDSAVPRHISLEPSKTKPKKDGGAQGYVPRSYRPPPPLPEEPQGAVLANIEAKQIFVYAPSRAYDAWAAVMAKRGGLRSWHLTTKKLIDGVWRTGWHFPSLFPPDKTGSTGPPTQSSILMTKEDEDEMMKG